MEINVKDRNSRTKKMMLWFGMISMSMTFAGLTSAYVVSSSRETGSKTLACQRFSLIVQSPLY